VNRHIEYAKENGWAQLVPRVVAGAQRRLRDSLTARKLGAANFRAGRHPRLLGLRHMKIGRNFSAGDQLWLEAAVAYREHRYKPELVIGDDVSLSDGVHIACLRRITIGSGLLAGCRVLITDHAHGDYSGSEQSDPQTMPARRPLTSGGEISIGRNVWLGDGVVVLAGAVIGDGAVIGANSVVSGMIPPNTIAAGTPARVLKQWDAARREWVRAQSRNAAS
jgi:acetyltransferase-like isoleucine patch superfamily enzyme